MLRIVVWSNKLWILDLTRIMLYDGKKQFGDDRG